MRYSYAMQAEMFEMMDTLAKELAGADGEPNGWKVLAEEMALRCDDVDVRQCRGLILPVILMGIAKSWDIDLEKGEQCEQEKN